MTMSSLKNLAIELGAKRLGISRYNWNIEMDTDELNADIVTNNTYYRERCCACSHIAAIFTCKNPTMDTLLSVGENHVKIGYKNNVHAEEDAINNLKPLGRNRNVHANMLVVCVTPSGKLHDSHPCVHCKRVMMEKPKFYGYRINRIYYTTNEGEIKEYTMNNLLMCETVHVSRYYRERKYNMAKWFRWRDSIAIALTYGRIK